MVKVLAFGIGLLWILFMLWGRLFKDDEPPAALGRRQLRAIGSDGRISPERSSTLTSSVITRDPMCFGLK